MLKSRIKESQNRSYIEQQRRSLVVTVTLKICAAWRSAMHRPGGAKHLFPVTGLPLLKPLVLFAEHFRARLHRDHAAVSEWTSLTIRQDVSNSATAKMPIGSIYDGC